MATVFTMYAGLAADTTHGNTLALARCNRATLLDCLNFNHSDGFTLFEGIGCFQGKEEPTVIVTFIAQTREAAEELGEQVAATAADYKKFALQQEVWITRREEELLIV